MEGQIAAVVSVDDTDALERLKHVIRSYFVPDKLHKPGVAAVADVDADDRDFIVPWGKAGCLDVQVCFDAGLQWKTSTGFLLL